MSGIEGGDVTMGPGPGKYTFKDYMNEEVGTEKLVDTAVSFSEYASDKPEFYRALIRACLRELDEEREALEFATEKVKWALDGEKMVRPDERDEGRVKKLEELLDALRSLLPETEGEA